jgi:hypothetical protein
MYSIQKLFAVYFECFKILALENAIVLVLKVSSYVLVLTLNIKVLI